MMVNDTDTGKYLMSCCVVYCVVLMNGKWMSCMSIFIEKMIFFFCVKKNMSSNESYKFFGKRGNYVDKYEISFV